MVEGQESLHTADGPTSHLCSATLLSGEEGLETFISPNSFQNRELGKSIKADKLM
jgi:hypothetical protein